MLKTSLRTIGLILCTINGIFAQIVEDFDPAQLTWTESPAKNLWQITTPDRRIPTINGNKTLTTKGYSDYDTVQEVRITSSAFSIPALGSSSEKIFLEFFSWQNLKTLDYVYVSLSTVDGSLTRQLKSIAYYDEKKWLYHSLDISVFAGKQVKATFRFIPYGLNYDFDKNALGITIDNLQLRSSLLPADHPIILNPLNDIAVVRNKTGLGHVSFAYKNASQEPVFKVSLSDSALVPPDSVKFTKRSDGSYDVRICPLKDQVGSVRLNLSVISGVHTDNKSFIVFVNDPQVLLNETFENPDYMRWTREPLSGRLFSIGETSLIAQSSPSSKKMLAMSLESTPNPRPRICKMVSNTFELPSSAVGTYQLSFKSFRAIRGCCGDYPKVKIRDANGVETLIMDLNKEEKKVWEVEQTSLAQFEGQKIQIVFEMSQEGISIPSYNNPMPGWFIDDVQVLYVGASLSEIKPLYINKIQNQLQTALGASTIPFTVFNPTGQKLAFTLSSSNATVVKSPNITVVGEKAQYNLAYNVIGIGKTTVQIIAKGEKHADTSSFQITFPTAKDKDSLLLRAIFDRHQLAAAGYNWDVAPMKSWIGVTLNPTGRVQAIQLNDKGEILGFPLELTKLDSLKTLSIGLRNFYGQIPAEIGNLKVLESLIFSYTKIFGVLPKEIGLLKKLKVLTINDSDLSGELPEEIGNLQSLEEFNYTGSNSYFLFPKALFKIATLKKININTYTGDSYATLPEGISNLKNLEEFKCYCSLRGALPEDFGALTNLKKLDLIGNYFDKLPNSFGNLQNLESLILQNNRIATLPPGLGQLKKLKTLNLAYNQIEGPFPLQIFDMISLEGFALNGNQFSGALPEAPTHLQNLKNIGLSDNQFNFMPPSWGQLTNLEGISLYNNLLDSMPDFSQMTKMSEILASGNYMGFKDFERNPKVNLSYRTQKFRPLRVVASKLGEDVSINADMSGSNNIYQWYKNGQIMVGQTASHLHLTQVTAADQSSYQCYVTNSVITNLTIKSSVFELFIQEDNNTLPVLADTVLNIGRYDYFKTLILFKAKDAENDSLRYKFLSPAGFFEITKNYALIANTDIISSSLKSVVVKILYYDKRGAFDTLNVTVNISNTNDTYGGSFYRYIDIPETTAPGTAIYQLSFTSNSNGALKYVSQSKEVFVDSTTGKVITTAAFAPDFDLKNEYEFTINAKDKQGKDYYVYLRVRILPAKNQEYNFEPRAQNHSFEVLRSDSLHTVIGTLKASDFNKDVLYYQLISTDSKFVIRPDGVITLNDVLDDILDSAVTLKARVYDLKGGNAYFYITIRALNKGIFVSPQSFNILENSASGTVLGRLTARDLNGASLTYSIEGDKSKIPFDFLSETDPSFMVVDSSLIDYEITKAFRFNVLITASNGTSKSVPITVTVEDVNDVTISVNDQRLSTPKVYPTLASDFVHVEAEGMVGHIQLLDLQGRVLGNWYPGKGQYTMATSHLDPNQYLLKIFVGQSVSQHKLVIIR